MEISYHHWTSRRRFRAGSHLPWCAMGSTRPSFDTAESISDALDMDGCHGIILTRCFNISSKNNVAALAASKISKLTPLPERLLHTHIPPICPSHQSRWKWCWPYPVLTARDNRNRDLGDHRSPVGTLRAIHGYWGAHSSGGYRFAHPAGTRHFHSQVGFVFGCRRIGDGNGDAASLYRYTNHPLVSLTRSPKRSLLMLICA